MVTVEVKVWHGNYRETFTGTGTDVREALTTAIADNPGPGAYLSGLHYSGAATAALVAELEECGRGALGWCELRVLPTD
jgi:hypothetical protein